ncbi:MAG: SusD/RagB family nutrient-binding outer membrane lipoprotein, partial [Segetibacter sp.]|nr:SusD/RagB family nutrient-binding outer membrane lipoprotein [Segetibacter sp.]
MKKKLYLIFAAVSISMAILSSCNKESLTNLNTPLNSVNYPIPAYLFTGALLNMPRDNYSVLAQGMQYFSTYKEVPAIGDKFYSFNGT